MYKLSTYPETDFGRPAIKRILNIGALLKNNQTIHKVTVLINLFCFIILINILSLLRKCLYALEHSLLHFRCLVLRGVLMGFMDFGSNHEP